MKEKFSATSVTIYHSKRHRHRRLASSLTALLETPDFATYLGRGFPNFLAGLPINEIKNLSLSPTFLYLKPV
jgi:hypothetical protein